MLPELLRPTDYGHWSEYLMNRILWRTPRGVNGKSRMTVPIRILPTAAIVPVGSFDTHAFPD
jgi:hypothetical protein